MGRTAKDKRDRPRPKPVERIELNEEHIGRRLAAMLVLLVVGAALLAYAFTQLLSPGEEWVEVQASTSAGPNAGSEFSFLYRPGSGELSYSADLKAVTALYTQLCRDAYLLFHNEEAAEGVCNLYAINRHPNEILEIDDGFYEAFAAVERSGSRAIYLGPVYDRYENLFFCEDDSQLPDFDPRLSQEVAQEYREVARFANDPDSIQVELLGEGRIRLAVSEEYLAYAQREEIDDFIDFAWMRNAFIADFLARGLTAGGYTCGALNSYDGFIRNLDGSGRFFSLNIYDLQDKTVYGAAVMNYLGPMSIVNLWDYPAGGLDQYRFYRLASGEMRTPYLDPADGMCRSSIHDLTCYARDKGCGEVLLEMMPVYIAGEFRPEGLTALAAKGIESVYCQENVIYCTDPEIQLDQLYMGENVQYRAEIGR